MSGSDTRVRAGAHPTQDDRHAQLAAQGRLRLDALDGRAAAEHDPGGEVLHLALAVDGRVGDHGHRLLEVVRQRHRHRGERPERAVPAQGADGLGAAVGVELELLLVALDPAGRGEQGLELELGRLELVVRVRVLLHRHRLESARQAGARLGAGQGAPALGAPVHLALHVPVVEHLRHAVLARDERDLLSRRQRRGVAGELGDGHDARLGRDRVHVLGLDPPQRPQAHRVHREDHLVRRPAGQRHGALGVGAERLAVVHVQVLELGGQPVHLAEDRRQRELDGLEQREALLEDQALQQAVEVLAVRAVVGDRQAELLALLTELGDGVDLAVVPQDRERLHAAEGGVGVRRVAVVGDDPRRGEVGVLHLRVEARDDLRLALHLVDRVVGRERGDVAVELALQLHHRAVAGGGGGGAALARPAGELPEDGGRLGGARPERAAVDRPLAAPEHLEAVLDDDLLDARHLNRGALGAVEEDVRHGEARVVDRVRVGALALHPPAPRGPGQVDHQAAPVALAVDAPGAVDHHLERGQGVLQHRAAGAAVAGREGGERARVVLDQVREAARRRGGERGRNGHARASPSVRADTPNADPRGPTRTPI